MSGIHAVADARAHLDRDHFFIDEAPHGFLEHAQLGGQLEIHLSVDGTVHEVGPWIFTLP